MLQFYSVWPNVPSHLFTWVFRFFSQMLNMKSNISLKDSQFLHIIRQFHKLYHLKGITMYRIAQGTKRTIRRVETFTIQSTESTHNSMGRSTKEEYGSQESNQKSDRVYNGKDWAPQILQIIHGNNHILRSQNSDVLDQHHWHWKTLWKVNTKKINIWLLKDTEARTKYQQNVETGLSDKV